MKNFRRWTINLVASSHGFTFDWEEWHDVACGLGSTRDLGSRKERASHTLSVCLFKLIFLITDLSVTIAPVDPRTGVAGTPKNYTVLVPGNSIKFEGLTPETPYNITVQGATNSGYGQVCSDTFNYQLGSFFSDPLGNLFNAGSRTTSHPSTSEPNSYHSHLGMGSKMGNASSRIHGFHKYY